MAKAERPWAVPNSPLSWSICRPKAEDESANPKPATKAAPGRAGRWDSSPFKTQPFGFTKANPSAQRATFPVQRVAKPFRVLS